MLVSNFPPEIESVPTRVSSDFIFNVVGTREGLPGPKVLEAPDELEGLAAGGNKPRPGEGPAVANGSLNIEIHRSPKDRAHLVLRNSQEISAELEVEIEIPARSKFHPHVLELADVPGVGLFHDSTSVESTEAREGTEPNRAVVVFLRLHRSDGVLIEACEHDRGLHGISGGVLGEDRGLGIGHETLQSRSPDHEGLHPMAGIGLGENHLKYALVLLEDPNRRRLRDEDIVGVAAVDEIIFLVPGQDEVPVQRCRGAPEESESPG